VLVNQNMCMHVAEFCALMMFRSLTCPLQPQGAHSCRTSRYDYSGSGCAVQLAPGLRAVQPIRLEFRDPSVKRHPVVQPENASCCQLLQRSSSRLNGGG